MYINSYQDYISLLEKNTVVKKFIECLLCAGYCLGSCACNRMQVQPPATMKANT